MKLIRLVLTGISLAFSIILFAATDPVATITFTNPVQENNLTLFTNTSASAEAFTEFVSKGDMDCLHIPASKYGYFLANDATITANDNNLIVNITYFNEGFGSLTFHYNATGGTNYKSTSLKKTGSNSWITTTISITDASFRNAQNNKADFRIAGDNYIRSITISKGVLDPALEKIPVTSGSSYSEFKGKSVAGYQAWFTASDNNSDWVHWSSNTRPKVGNFSFEIYPDVSEYLPEALSLTDFANLGNGEPSVVFSSAKVIGTHFKWMKDNGIDGVALQRFIGDSPYPVTNDPSSKPVLVKQEAEKNNRIFYVCYDMSSGSDENAWVESIKFDWVYNIEQSYALTSSPAYATVNNKPVVQIWGPGFTSRVGNSAGTIKLIGFLKSRGCYVIGGVPTNWRTESGDSKPGFMTAYKAYDMVSPWTPGRYRDLPGCDIFKTNYIIPDKNFCDANGLDYMPVLFPGFGWSTWNTGSPNSIPRLAGEFLWRQAYNIKNTGITQMYFAMFDEYDEGTAIMKAATDWSMIPTDQYFLTMGADGIWLSSDFYLRAAGAATAMLKAAVTPPSTITIPYSEGPVYYRNSFEKRYTQYVDKEGGPILGGTYNLDPCFYKPLLLGNNLVTMPVCEIEENQANAKSGKYTVRVSGSPNSADKATYDYKFSEVSIPVVAKMTLSFWKKTANELGRYVSLDLMFKSGKRLSQLASYVDNNGALMQPGLGKGNVGSGFEHFTCNIGKGELLGDVITGILVSYNKAASTGSFSAYFDDVLVTTGDIPVVTGVNKPIQKTTTQIFVENNVLNFRNVPLNSDVTIFSISGMEVKSFKLTNNRVSVNLPGGVYVVTTKSSAGNYAQKILLSH